MLYILKKDHVLYIDSREGIRKKFFKEFFESKHYEVISNKQLEYGDYLYNDCIFEYKTVKDLRDSINNGNIFEQSRGMIKEGYSSVNIIIVGEINPDNHYDWQLSYLGWKTRMLQTCNVHDNVLDNEQAGIVIHKMFQTYNDGKSVPRKFKDKNYNTAINILDSLHSCSWNNAVKISTYYQINSIEDILNLNINDLKKIKGIGDKTANTIYSEIHNIPLNHSTVKGDKYGIIQE